MKGAAKSAAVVDLFCGVGGLTHGLERAGLQVSVGVDSDPSCEYAYSANNNARFVLADVGGLTATEMQRYWGEARYRVLVGCAPCQPFSRYANARRAPTDDWQLVPSFARLVLACSPDIVSIENVPELTRHPAYTAFSEALADHGYSVWADIVNCCDYGIPQTRHRLVLLASRLGQIELMHPTHTPGGYISVGDTIRDLPPLPAGGHDTEDPLHRSSRLSETNIARVRAAVPGGTWRDWPEHLRLACHQKASGRSYPSVYGRMTWGEPAPTITTQCYGLGNGRFGHPEQDRAISLREAALLQTFPRSYAFVPPVDPIRTKQLGRHIGNAVPVRLGEIIGRSIVRHLEGNSE